MTQSGVLVVPALPHKTKKEISGEVHRAEGERTFARCSEHWVCRVLLCHGDTRLLRLLSLTLRVQQCARASSSQSTKHSRQLHALHAQRNRAHGAMSVQTRKAAVLLVECNRAAPGARRLVCTPMATLYARTSVLARQLSRTCCCGRSHAVHAGARLAPRRLLGRPLSAPSCAHVRIVAAAHRSLAEPHAKAAADNKNLSTL